MFHFGLSFFMMLANITVLIALRYMKSVKKATVIFLYHLAICNLVHSVVFFVKAMFFVYDVNTVQGCLILNVLSITTTATYVSGIFFVYLDLYLSIKTMRISKPVIGTKQALALGILAWLGWLSASCISYGFRNMDYVYNFKAGCSLVNGAYIKEYSLGVLLPLMLIYAGIMWFHLCTYKMIKKAKSKNEADKRSHAAQLANSKPSPGSAGEGTEATPAVSQPKASAQAKWIKKNDDVLKVITLVMIMFVICWYPLAIVLLIVAYCPPCLPYVTKEVVYVTYALAVIQFNSNGVIYLLKIREFKDVCKKLFFRCCPKHGRVEQESSTVQSVTTVA